jgi:hypothetical protein
VSAFSRRTATWKSATGSIERMCCTFRAEQAHSPDGRSSGTVALALRGAKWLDLLMLTLFAGRERTERQWRELLAGAGFEPVRFGFGVIEARSA